MAVEYQLMPFGSLSAPRWCQLTPSVVYSIQLPSHPGSTLMLWKNERYMSEPDIEERLSHGEIRKFGPGYVDGYPWRLAFAPSVYVDGSLGRSVTIEEPEKGPPSFVKVWLRTKLPVRVHPSSPISHV